MEDTSIKLLALKEIKGYGNKKVLDLIKAYGNIEKLCDHVSDKLDLTKSENILRRCKADQIQIITYFDETYPDNLKKISSPPLILFAKGNLKLLNAHSLSIVGTRTASQKSIAWAYETSKRLADLGNVIISGGAIGIDAAAHKGALSAAGDTICVLGCGLKNIYPKENLELIEEISKKGLVISEYPPEYNVNRLSLLERNRITSGLGDELLLVATKVSGGAMSQYKKALSQKKQIFCVNPDLELEPTEGIKQIIQNNKSIKVISTVQELLEYPKISQHQKIINTFA